MNRVFLFLLFCLATNFATAATESLPDDSIYQVQSNWLDQFGKTQRLESLRGKPVAISMVYLTCQYTCPTTILRMKSLEKMLSDQGEKDIQFVLVSFDPKHDTPAIMKKYAAKHSLAYPKWRFLTSKSEPDMRELASLLDFKYKKIAGGDFEHSFGIIVLDKNGRIRGSTVGAAMEEKDLVPLLTRP